MVKNIVNNFYLFTLVFAARCSSIYIEQFMVTADDKVCKHYFK